MYEIINITYNIKNYNDDDCINIELDTNESTTKTYTSPDGKTISIDDKCSNIINLQIKTKQLAEIMEHIIEKHMVQPTKEE